MYDNIRLLLPYPFTYELERETFCKRFNLFIKDEKKGILHNKGYEGLGQNKGIYIKIELPLEKRKGTLSISLSLHKFYNAMINNDLRNYDYFSFDNANEAYRLLSDLLKIDLSMSVVKQFEVGINIETKTDPDEYMRELSLITVKARKMRIIEDLHYKEYKQYSTHKDRDKRIIYIFYNKTFEARSKQKDVVKRENIPENILRIEKDTHRPVEKIYFYQLFEPVFQQLTKQEFKQRFVEDLEYKAHYIKTKDINKIQLDVIETIESVGTEKAIQEQKELVKQGIKTKRQLQYFMKQVKEITEKGIKAESRISKIAEITKCMIINTLETM